MVNVIRPSVGPVSAVTPGSIAEAKLPTAEICYEAVYLTSRPYPLYVHDELVAEAYPEWVGIIQGNFFNLDTEISVISGQLNHLLSYVSTELQGPATVEAEVSLISGQLNHLLSYVALDPQGPATLEAEVSVAGGLLNDLQNYIYFDAGPMTFEAEVSVASGSLTTV